MKFSLKFLSSASTILFISSMPHISTSMEDKESPKKGLPSLKGVAARGGKVSNIQEGREDLRAVPTKKAAPHPKKLTYKQLREIFFPTEESKGPKNSIILQVEIESVNVNVYCSPKTNLGSDIRNALQKCELPGQLKIDANFEEYMIKNRGVDHTLATICDRASLPGYKLSYENGDIVPGLITTLYLAFAANSEELPDIVVEESEASEASEAGEGEPKEQEGKGKEKKDKKDPSEVDPGSKGEKEEPIDQERKKEDRESSLKEQKEESIDRKEKKAKRSEHITPLKKIPNDQLLEIFQTLEAVEVIEESGNRYKIALEDIEQKGAIIGLLKGKNGKKFYAILSRYIGDSEISNTLGTQGQTKQRCEYILQKERKVRKDVKAKAPRGYTKEKRSNFPTFTVSFYYDDEAPSGD